MLRVLMGPFGAWAVAVAAGGHRAGAGLDGARRLRRHRPAQHQAADGLFRHRQHRLRAGRRRRRDDRRRQRRPGLHGDLPGHDAGHLRLHPADAPRRAATWRPSPISPACRATGRCWRWRWRSACSRWPASRRWPASSASSTCSAPRSMPGWSGSRSSASSCRWWAPTTICGSSRCSTSTSRRRRSTRRPRRRSGAVAAICAVLLLFFVVPFLSSPVLTSAAAAAAALAQVRGAEFGHGFRLLDLATVGSTNDVARGLAEAGRAGRPVRPRRAPDRRPRPARAQLAVAARQSLRLAAPAAGAAAGRGGEPVPGGGPGPGRGDRARLRRPRRAAPEVAQRPADRRRQARRHPARDGRATGGAAAPG